MPAHGGLGIPNDIDRSPDGLRVQGIEGLLTNLGKCCHPVPGDPIVGYVTKGRGVTIHRQSCPNISRTLAQGNGRVIEVSWTAKQEHTYPVKIQVSAYDRSGLVRDVAALVADERVNMRNIEAVTGQKDNLAVITATLEIQDISQLTRIMTKIDRLPEHPGGPAQDRVRCGRALAGLFQGETVATAAHCYQVRLARRGSARCVRAATGYAHPAYACPPGSSCPKPAA